MHIQNSSQGYGAIAMALHWIVAVLVLAAWLLGQFGDALPRGAAQQTGLFVHISIGLSIIVFMIARLVRRLSDPPPPPEKSLLGPWGERAARAVHYLLYAGLFAVPAAGIVVQFAGGHALPVFGLFELPSPWPADRTFARQAMGVHEVLANATLTLAGLHAAAALAHHYIFHDRTLLRMLPVARS